MSKNTEKNLCQYIKLLEKLLILIMDNREKKNYEAQRKLEKLKILLSKRGITPEEIESSISINEPYDKNLENLSDDLVKEYIPVDINNINITLQQKDIINYIEQQHAQFKQLGINEANLKTWNSLNSYGNIKNTKVIEKGEPLFMRLDAEEEVDYLQSIMKK